MYLKVFEYLLEKEGALIPPRDHFDLFSDARGPDEFGQFAEYRGQKNAVLMEVRRSTLSNPAITGLVGKHSTEREITDYDAETDATISRIVRDNDYPNAPFVCFPEDSIIVVVDRQPIQATSATARLHKIFAHRTGAWFRAYPITHLDDLSAATKTLRVTEVFYEVSPVNPHTGDLGKALDDSREKDHIERMVGKLYAQPSKPVSLEGGFASQIHELQESGHARAGYLAYTDDGVELKVEKPSKKRSKETTEEAASSESDVRVKIDDKGISYPFPLTFLTRIAEIVGILRRLKGDESK